MNRIPRIVIAGTQSGTGKTSVATALMAAFCRRGLQVQPFKVGPDFIDPGFHSLAAGRASRNLDGWMLTRETNLSLFDRACCGADLAIIEGVMGLFDGRDGASESGSTAEMAKWLGAPVLLVVDASAIARSVAAIVRGFEDLDPDLRLAGVLLNRVAGISHYVILEEAIAASCGSRTLGYLEIDRAIALPERHLGLQMAGEVLDPKRIDSLVEWIEKTLDLNEILRLAEGAWGLPRATDAPLEGERDPRALRETLELAGRPRIGVARDPAFSFYYADNLDLLEQLGGEMVSFSPLHDDLLPESLDGIYLGGGYPELHGRQLASNSSMRESIAKLARDGAPIYAECGGLMYLAQAIVDLDGIEHPMVGVFPIRARMRPSMAAIGYREIETKNAVAWLPSGIRGRGHEFRYSTIDAAPGSSARCYAASNGRDSWDEGFCDGGVVGSYIHLHFHSCKRIAGSFVEACSMYRRKRAWGDIEAAHGRG